jgi:hypothetical protein
VGENKICLVISHEGVEGVFHSVIRVGNQWKIKEGETWKQTNFKPK